MGTTDLVSCKGGGKPYSSPELTVLTIAVEQGFQGSFGADSMTIQPEDEW